MKKIYMIVAAVLTASAMLLNAQPIQLSGVESLWGKALTSNGNKSSCMGGQLVKANNGDLFMVAFGGSATANDVIKFGDDPIANGIDYSGTSANRNFILSKITQEGQMQWTIASTMGEVAANEEWAVATADGGVVVAFKAHHTLGHLAEDINFRDAKGNNVKLNWVLNADAKRYYNGVVMKVSSEGAIEWVTQLAMDNKPRPNAGNAYKDNTSEGIKVNGIATDANGNLYVSGRMMTEMTITKTDGSTVKIAPHNVDTWNGDPQKSVGNAFIVKLDAMGHYLAHFVSGGKSVNDAIRTMTIKDGKLYGLVMMQGIKDTEMKMGDKGVTPQESYNSLGTVCMDLDLQTVHWFNLYESTIKGSMVNNSNMKVNDDAILLMGQAKYEIKIGNKQLKSNDTRDAMLLKADRETGKLLDGTIKQKAFSSYFDTFQDKEQNLYVGTFALGGALAIEKINTLDMTVADRVELFPKSNTAQSLVTDGNKLFAMSSFDGENVKSIAGGTPFTVSAKSKGCLISAYSLPFQAATLVHEVENEKVVIGTQYYNLQGVASSTAFDGINVVVTHYSDGSRSVTKMMK